MDRPRQFSLAFLFQQLFWIAVVLALLRFLQSPDHHLSFDALLFRKCLLVSLAGIAGGTFVGNFFGRAIRGGAIGGIIGLLCAAALFFFVRSALDSV
jgi:hypothetical protein